MTAVSQAGTLRSCTERRPRVMLEWDPTQKMVVAPLSQVGISWSQFATKTKAFGSHLQARLVDGFDIPEELLELPDLNDILSVETWEHCLTPSEREMASAYLPEDVDPMSAVEALLSGRNFHFGNPLQTWGESLCSGTMHPDAILHRELKLKEQRKAYSKRLKSYHRHMVQNLLSMKKIWEACEDSEGFLRQIERRHVFPPYRKADEIAGVRKRHRYELGEPADQAGDVSIRSKAKKQKVNRLSEDGSRRLKIRPLEVGMEKVKIKLTGELADMSTRLKGGKNGQSEKGTKPLKMRTSEAGTSRPKVKSGEGVKRLEIKPLEEGRTKGQFNSLQDERRRPKMKAGDEAAERLEMTRSAESLLGPKTLYSEDVTGGLTVKLSADGRAKLEMKPAAESSERLQDNEKDSAKRPPTKRLNVKLSKDGAKRLGSEHSDKAPKTSQIKASVSEIGKNPQRNKLAKDEREPPSRPKAKKDMLKALSVEDETQRLNIKLSEGASRRLKVNPSRGEPEILKMKPSEEGGKIKQIEIPNRKKGLKLKPLEGGQVLKNLPQDDKDVLSRPAEKMSKAALLGQGTKKFKVKDTYEGQDHSDFEGEWFKKYVQVTVGPLSGHRLSKAIQSVKVTLKMLNDVKRRSEAGEEVHIDTLVPSKPLSRVAKASKKANNPSIIAEKDVEEIITSFWRTVLIKDLPAVHARFVQRREQLQKLAVSLASSCKNFCEIELGITDGVPEEDTSQNGDDGSPSPGVALRFPESTLHGPESTLHSVGKPFFNRPSAPLIGEEDSPIGENPVVLQGGQGMKSGDESWHGGEKGRPSREEVMPSGDDAILSGDHALQSGDEASPGEAEPEEIWGINSLLLLRR